MPSSSTAAAELKHVGAEAKRGVPREWCAKYGLSNSVSFALSLYTEEAALILADYWCERLQFWYDMWISSGGDPRYGYTNEEIASFQPSPEWIRFKESFYQGGATHGRAMWLDTVRPTNPSKV